MSAETLELARKAVFEFARRSITTPDHEGFVSIPTPDLLKPEQYNIGYGSACTPNEVDRFSIHPITHEEALGRLERDMWAAWDDINAIYGAELLAELRPVRIAVLLEMAYQMNRASLAGFTEMHEALRKKDYASAAKEILDSELYRSGERLPGIKNRCETYYNRMLKGVFS